MGLFAIGDLVVIPFPYTDLSKSKMRPALVVAKVDNDDYIMLQITSKNYEDHHSVLISSKDLTSGELRFDSYVKYSKIFTANRDIIEKKIGKLSNDKTKIVIDSIIKLLKNKKV